MTNEQIERAAEVYATQKTEQDVPESYGEMTHRRVAMLFDSYDIEQAFEDGYAACEQSMTDSEAIVIQGWVARDECGFLAIYKRKPERELNPYVNRPSVWNGEVITTLNEDSFLSLTWSDEPIEVELTIKLKKR